MSTYRRLLHQRPILVQSLTTGCLFITGDVIAQKWIEKRETFDLKRTCRLAFYGTCFAGPAVSNWYRFLGKNIQFGSKLKNMLARMTVDQVFFAPSFLAMFLSVNGVLEGLSIEQIKEKFNHAYKTALITNYQVWPAIQCITFYLIPLHYQTLFVNSLGTLWNAYLSYMNQKTLNERIIIMKQENQT